MKKLTSLLVVAILAAAVLAVPGVSAHEGEEHAEGETHTAQAEAPAEENTEDQTAQESAAYNYVAQEGDSYTVLARKAIQTYGIVNGVNLSGAEIVFAETNLTRQAGSPVLTTSQDVSIAEADVKQWIEAAQALSDEEEAGWEYYVQFVDFNTDAAGEARS